MGSSKKKEKKKKKRREKDSDNDSPIRHASNISTQDYPTLEEYYGTKDKLYTDEYENKSRSKTRKDSDKSKRKSRTVPQTEEYVYDYSGQEIVQGSRDMSISPERSRSPISRKSKRDLTPPPLPPGMGWPLGASQNQPKPPGDDDFNDWKQKDDRNRDRDYQAEVDRKYRNKQKEDNKLSEVTDTPTSNDGSSLSIEETNKLRAKLGLKPLKVGDDENSGEKSYDDREDVHQPAVNISEKKNEDKMREKMEAIREKRRINQKLRKTKGLAAEDDPVLDSAAAWVAKSRQQEKEKLLADKRAQVLEEMDEEFGISTMVEETVRKIKQEPSYTSRDLKGLKVQHKGNAFQEGSQIVLTLEDKGILEEDNEDVLINVNIADDERTKKNLENRQKKPGYKAYDEVDDETGMLKVRGVLDKYDEDIRGSKKASFIIDDSGKANDRESELDKIRDTLKAQQVSLAMDAPRLARDYYTEEELVQFKKPRKKVRKVRKRNLLKADDLLKLNQDAAQDRGSRNQRNVKKTSHLTTSSADTNGEEVSKGENPIVETSYEDMDIVPAAPDELDYFVAVSQHEEPVSFIEDDEAEQELQLALDRSRRTKQKKGNESDEENVVLEKIALEVLNKPKRMETEIEHAQSTTKSKKKVKTTIVLDSTSEFCRTLGDLPTVGSTVKSKKQQEQTDEDMEIENIKAESKQKGGWEQVDYDDIKEESVDVKDEEDEDVLEAEPLPTGIAATLNLANMKGYLKDGNEKVRKFDPLNLPETKAEVDVEKLRDEEKGKYARGYDRDRDRYDPYAFKDKSNYKPDFKLEYVDNKGRALNQKEAFRLLSHKFHGKGSGKLKTEKRAKKIVDEKKLLNMSSIDTPLNTASMFKEKQKLSQTPYLVLSGGAKNLLTGQSLKK